MNIHIMTRLGRTSFVHDLRGNDAESLEIEIKEVVKWFISTPPSLRGYTDTRILLKTDKEKQIFQFTMDYHKDERDIQEEMKRFEASLSDQIRVNSILDERR